MSLDQEHSDALNLLAKWRTIFVSQQLGTVSSEDPTGKAVRHTAEQLLVMRAELSAFVGLCMKKGLFSREEFQRAVITECDELQKQLERMFPGCKATPIGMDIDVQTAYTYMKHWKP